MKTEVTEVTEVTKVAEVTEVTKVAEVTEGAEGKRLPVRMPEAKPPATRKGVLLPAFFLAWGIYGMVRPMFDAGQSYDPIFWAVAGASLLSLYGRFHTKGLDDIDTDDIDEPLDDKWRFTIPHLLKKHPKDT